MFDQETKIARARACVPIALRCVKLTENEQDRPHRDATRLAANNRWLLALYAVGTHQRYDRLKQMMPGVNASANSIAEH
jgi:hypothetical protein